MLRLLFPRPPKAVARGVHLYFAEAKIIVAAIHQNATGMYYEQPAAVVLPANTAATALGVRFREAFDAFSVKDADLAKAKPGDWPAYQASRLRSLKEFQRMFRPVHCYGMNPSNALVRASTVHPSREGIELAVHFNPLLDAETIGKSLRQLVDAASG